MTAIAPSWLLAARGLLANGDTHAVDGYHFRIHASPLLGLPIAPFAVYRLGIDRPVFRTDLLWIDSHGAVLQPPFDVHGDNPVYGYLPAPADGVCGWFQVIGSVQGGLHLPTVPAAAPRAAARARAVARRTASRAPRTRAVDPITAPLPFLKVEAQVSTARGWATVASRSAAPWVVTSSPIERVQITGNGHLDSGRWIDLVTLPDNIDIPLAKLALPVESGRRYQGMPNAPAYARLQATRAASARRALQEAPGAADPSAAPAWTGVLEGLRLDALDDDLVADTQALVDDVARQRDVRRRSPITQAGTTLPGDGLDQPVLSGVLSAMQDAAVARLMGFLTFDDDPPMAVNKVETASGLVYYAIGLWEVEERDGEFGVVQSLSADEQAGLGRTDIFRALPFDAKVLTTADEVAAALAVAGLDPPPGPLGPVAVLTTAVVTLADDPMPAAPAAPAIDTIDAADPPWLPAPAPAATRQIDLALDGLGAGAGLAVARRSGTSITWLSINKRSGLNHTLMVAAAPSAASLPGGGEVSDRTAPALALDYRVAQTDVFGRWSQWSTASVEAGVRPLPPQPIVQATFTPAVVPSQPTEAPLAGQLRISIAVPAPGDLAPGSFLLERVSVHLDGMEIATAVPGSGSSVVAVAPAPALTRAARADVAVTAIWRDTAGQLSPESTPVHVNCYDLRTPAQATLASGLLYASRRDATGRCRAEISWPVLPGQQYFRVYGSTETTLRTHLEDQAADGDTSAAALLDQLGVMSAPDRGALLRTEKQRFPRNLFQLLTDSTIAASGATARFEHALSASLIGLALYRVVAVASTNVEAPFADADLLPVAVPNSPPPRAPSLEVASVDVPVASGTALGIRVTLTVPAGRSGATEYRLFRSTEETRDVGRMPLIAAGALAAAAIGVAQQHTILLVGDPAPGVPDPAVVGGYDEVVSADIRVWMRYFFRADVRGATEPGSGVNGAREMPGVWSDAAAPVALLVITGEPPTAPTGLIFQSRTNTIRWQHADQLRGRNAGDYVFDVYRTAPGQREALFTSIVADAAPDQGGRSSDGTGTYHVIDPDAAGGVRYRVVLGDPLGRPSPFAELTI